jgi:hypothetical protein
MNAAEIKSDLFRRIDNLPKADLENMYNEFLALLNNTTKYKLTKTEHNAIKEALAESKNKNIHSRENVISEAKQKYPNLKFE